MRMEEDGLISCAAESMTDPNTHFEIIETEEYNTFKLRCPNKKYVIVVEVEYTGRMGPYKLQVLSCAVWNKKKAAVFRKDENRSP